MHVNSAILLMAYGTPRSEQEIEPYLTDIRRGRKPNATEIQDLKERYRKIGGSSPLLEITYCQASQLENKLFSEGLKTKVYVGMKHWHPLISETVQEILNAGHQRIIGLVLAPHYSKMSIGGYKKALDAAVGSTHNVSVDFIESWYDHPLFHKAVAERIDQALKKSKMSKIHVLFTAHSLPERILKENDPYPEELLASCRYVAKSARLSNWSFAYQSAGQTGEKWLGPDIIEALEGLSSKSKDISVLVVPIGFVSDHLEILYDVDIEAKLFAETHGIKLKRIESLNTQSTFIAALTDIVKKRISEG